MLNKIIAGLMITTAIATSAAPTMAAPQRSVSPRLVALLYQRDQCTAEDNENAPTCIIGDAVVDIESGYLRVWATDKEGNAYVVGKLRRNEKVSIRSVRRIGRQWVADILYLRDECWQVTCTGRVDMSYLR